MNFVYNNNNHQHAGLTEGKTPPHIAALIEQMMSDMYRLLP